MANQDQAKQAAEQAKQAAHAAQQAAKQAQQAAKEAALSEKRAKQFSESQNLSHGKPETKSGLQPPKPWEPPPGEKKE